MTVRVSPVGARSGGWKLPMAVLVVGMFMAVLGTSIANVAIPYIQRDLGADPDTARWVSTGYILTLGVVVPLAGWLGQRFGQARVLIVALALFTIATGVCGLAWDIRSLIVLRVLQAIPGGIIPVPTLTILFRIVPPDRLGAAMGMFGLGVVLAPALGPAAGGWLVEYVNWQMIFFSMVPVGVVAVFTGLWVLPQAPPTQWPRLDAWGFGTIGTAVVCLMLGCDRGPDWGWTSYPVMILFVTSVLSLALFVVIELERDEPLIDVRAFRSWTYSNSVVLLAIHAVGLYALLYYVPQFLQIDQGYQAFEAGMLLMPSALAMALAMPVAGWLFDRVGARWPAVCGLALATWGSFLLAGLTPDLPRGQIIAWTTIRNVGVGLSMMPIMTAGLAQLRGRQADAGNVFNNVTLRVAASLGVAVVGGLVTVQHAQLMADRGAFVVAGATAPQALTRAAAQGAEGLAPLYQELTKAVVAVTYANAFYTVGWLTAIGVLLAAFLPGHSQSRPQPDNSATAPRDTTPARPAQVTALRPRTTDTAQPCAARNVIAAAPTEALRGAEIISE
jgi:EmrB/QacA subfamily drug resistance transporter